MGNLPQAPKPAPAPAPSDDKKDEGNNGGEDKNNNGGEDKNGEDKNASGAAFFNEGLAARPETF